MTSTAEKVVDFVYSNIPRARVTGVEWGTCRLVAHRGCHDNGKSTHENTIAAFETACQAGVWGIEFDVQWTKDQVPVVIHDSDTARIPCSKVVEVGHTNFDQLREVCPIVPRLDEVVEQFGKRIHLMIETKSDTLNSQLMEQFSAYLTSLEPVQDYHILSLQTDVLRAFRAFPVESRILVALTNTKKMFRETLLGKIGGLSGHFLLLNGRMRKELAAREIPWGTGFVNSTNVVAREIRSGTRWLYSDAALQVAEKLNRSV